MGGVINRSLGSHLRTVVRGLSTATVVARPSGEPIPLELAGKGIRFRLLRSFTSAYPSGHDLVYTDQYTPALSGRYSLKAILGSDLVALTRPSGDWGVLRRALRESPLENPVGEEILEHIIVRTAQVGSWQPLIIDVVKLANLPEPPFQTADEYLAHIDAVRVGRFARNACKGLSLGIATAQKGGFVHPLVTGNYLVVLPTQAFVEYLLQFRQAGR